MIELQFIGHGALPPNKGMELRGKVSRALQEQRLRHFSPQLIQDVRRFGEVFFVQKSVALSLVSCVILGCAEGGLGEVSSGYFQVATFVCSDNTQVKAQYFDEPSGQSARVTIAGLQYAMKRERSASGSRYSSGDITWWERSGVGMVLTRDEVDHRDCAVVHD